MMVTVGGSDAEREQHHEASRRGDDHGSLLSTRTLVIITVSGIIGLLAGVSAGVAAGLQAAPLVGSVAGVALGLTAGIVAAAMTGGLVAATLHTLVGRSG